MTRKKPRIPNFEILSFCGEGASSEVWLGVDSDGITRAIKVMDLSSPEKQKFIEQENKAITAYRNITQKHPNMLDILYIGRTSKFLYYISELADNVSHFDDHYEPETLEWRLKTRLFSIETTLDVIEKITEAVAFLHENNLAHRDIKPGNILFVQGEPKIADPGLLCQSSVKSKAGTVGFKIPWNATAMESDVYAIGKLLYCMYSREDALNFPSLPPTINTSSIKSLNMIALKCCDPEYEEPRYRNASELLSDIRKIRNGSVIQQLYRSRTKFILTAALFLLALSLALNIVTVIELRPKQIGIEQADKLFTWAIATFNNGEIMKAKEVLETIKKDCPDLAKKPKFKKMLTQVNKKASWLYAYNQITKNDFDSQILFEHMNLFSDKEKLSTYDKMSAMSPDLKKSLPFLVNYYFLLEKNGRRNDSDKILDEIKDYQDTEHNNIMQTVYYTKIANHLNSQKNNDAALLFANKVCELSPLDCHGFITRFKINLDMGNTEDALKDMQKTKSISPENIFLDKMYIELKKRKNDMPDSGK